MLFTASLLIALLLPVFAYIPASPTNSTRDAILGGLNITDVSKIHMQWYSNGSYSEHVSYQLVGNGSTGISKGVLVHFSEEKANNFTPPTLTPWIALVSCDKNATDASMEIDIFTLARDKGAVAALLYSLYSTACVINSEYSDPSTFDKVFDIFSTQSSTSSHIIEYQFAQLGPQNKSIYSYDSTQLNNSANVIMESIAVGLPVSAGYLLAVLEAFNATDNSTASPNTGDSSGSNSGGSGGSNPPNTALAMIILYAITGCVSALFCVVIISGAIRAIRHPERYGPRSRMGEDGGPPQSRARGLTRAILDTFPIVKFGSTQTVPGHRLSELSGGKDVEGQLSEHHVEMSSMIHRTENSTPEPRLGPPDAVAPPTSQSEPGQNSDAAVSRIPYLPPSSPVGSTGSGTNRRQSADNGEGPSKQAAVPNVVPASIGREICPICIVDFEEGDDIRVLPCEGNHCFHQTCVDPWLLKLSSSCPICRHDFLALENMLSGHTDSDDEAENHIPQGRSRSSTGRFSRYLRFAHRRQRRRGELDPTDPYMPTAPETAVYSGL